MIRENERYNDKETWAKCLMYVNQTIVDKVEGLNMNSFVYGWFDTLTDRAVVQVVAIKVSNTCVMQVIVYYDLFTIVNVGDCLDPDLASAVGSKDSVGLDSVDPVHWSVVG